MFYVFLAKLYFFIYGIQKESFGNTTFKSVEVHDIKAVYDYPTTKRSIS